MAVLFFAPMRLDVIVGNAGAKIQALRECESDSPGAYRMPDESSLNRYPKTLENLTARIWANTIRGMKVVLNGNLSSMIGIIGQKKD